MRIFGLGDDVVSSTVPSCEDTSKLGPAIDLSMCHHNRMGQRGRQGRRRGKVVWPQGEKHIGQGLTPAGHGVTLSTEG